VDRQDDWGGSTTSTSTPSTQTSAPFFVKFCSYFPYNAKLCLNGHEWAKRQAAKAGLGFTALNNGFATCADAEAVQAICDRLGAEQIDALLRKWLTRLPHPFTGADRAAGYRYDLSVLQAEFSLTQVLDRPICGRVFLEQVIRDNLNVGRPDQVSLVFDRRIHRGRRQHTPGRFRTRVLTEGVTPSLHIDYKSHHDQAAPQGRTRAKHPDHDQRPRRRRHPYTADPSARAAGDRPLRPPAPARRPTTQP
jgi:hypothetical protein